MWGFCMQICSLFLLLLLFVRLTVQQATATRCVTLKQLALCASDSAILVILWIPCRRRALCRDKGMSTVLPWDSFSLLQDLRKTKLTVIRIRVPKPRFLLLVTSLLHQQRQVPVPRQHTTWATGAHKGCVQGPGESRPPPEVSIRPNPKR